LQNPNCSNNTTGIGFGAPTNKKYKMKRVVISTYQSVSGTGLKAVPTARK